ncbi:MAG TPA: hypothetical protein VGP04_16320 [Pseudonocardiaceae bacterium]|nr:hypothetical protein [Pseudonocardiaceae bacterium]
MRIARQAQSCVQHGPILTDVDVVAAEHRLDAPTQVDSLHQGDEQLQSLGGNPVLGIVQIQIHSLYSHPPSPIRIAGEKLPQVQVLHLLVVVSQRGPLRGGGDVQDSHAFFSVVLASEASTVSVPSVSPSQTRAPSGCSTIAPRAAPVFTASAELQYRSAGAKNCRQHQEQDGRWR